MLDSVLPAFTKWPRLETSCVDAKLRAMAGRKSEINFPMAIHSSCANIAALLVIMVYYGLFVARKDALSHK